MRGLLFSLAALAACTPAVTTTTGGSTSGGAPAADADRKYPGHGFIVHEWGTDTIVVGSDGSVQRGLHHEEEDLPGFVYDRMKAGALPGSTSVEVKMETPVTYFYSDEPRTVNASVAFPQGVFTQWYPAALSFFPHVAYSNATTKLADPVFDLAFPFGSTGCATKYGAVADGVLDWGAVDILGRDAAATVPEAPLDQYTWSYARDVAANPVRISGVPGATTADQDERFLFYRGLGNFQLPVTVTAPDGEHVSLANGYGEPIGRVIVMNVNDGVGMFDVHPEGIAAGATLEAGVPPAHGLTLDDFAESLGSEVTRALDATGLYHDEAQAMVSTWKRQWFKTPGVRLLYLVPQSWTDASIPLTVTPEPDETVRVMMIRVEVLTPEMEKVDVGYAGKLADPGTAGEADTYFTSLGRFAEPRLRRALSLLGSPAYAEAYLATVATASTHDATGE